MNKNVKKMKKCHVYAKESVFEMGKAHQTSITSGKTPPEACSLVTV
jgi:hypothetical protein